MQRIELAPTYQGIPWARKGKQEFEGLAFLVIRPLRLILVIARSVPGVPTNDSEPAWNLAIEPAALRYHFAVEFARCHTAILLVPKGDRDLSVPAVPQARPGFTLAAIFATSHGGGDGVKGRASDERSELALDAASASVAPTLYCQC
jgi:hypothetical protein